MRPGRDSRRLSAQNRRSCIRARELGCTTFGFGRSNVENHGLVAFKDPSGATASELTYWRHPPPRWTPTSLLRTRALVPYLMPLVPDWLLVRAGRMLYPH